jgi:hypothetical protein
LIGLALLIAAATGSACATPSRTPNIVALSTCEAAFRAWVDGADSLNDPGANVVEIVAAQERVQRRVFELCTLAEAERFNREMPLTPAAGVSTPMIEPGIRSFAEVECVDEAPLLEGTRLCTEVRR